MSWKTAEPDSRGSIARRLAYLHIVAVFIGYTVFGLLFYEKRMSQKQSMEARELAAEIVSLKTMMRDPNGRQMLQYEMRAQLFESDSSRMYIRILDRNGRTLSESPGMERAVPPGAFTSEAGRQPVRWLNGSGDHFVLRSARLPDRLFCGPGCLLQIATNSNDRARHESQLRWALVLFVFSGTVFAFVCAYLIVRFGLKPLDDISRTARSITRHDLHKRIDESALPAELVSLAQSFNCMLARLEESFEGLSHYSANLAHELRTPINTLTIAAEIALSRERAPEEYRTVLSSSLEELGRVSVTIDKMLFLARAEIGEPVMSLQKLEVAAEVESLFDFYSDMADEAGVSLTTSGSSVLYADQTLFRRALSNLISNSLAHTPRGGTIAVACRASLGEDGAAVAVVVADSGRGIDSDHLPHIFDRFYRVAGSRVHGARQDGTGLGLAIVKAIMQMHGGCVSIDSRPGSGTEVTLTFPLKSSFPA